MSRSERGIPCVLSTLCLLVSIFGCASPSYRAHPEFKMRVKTVRKPVLMVSGITIHQISPGGVVELRDDWSAAAKRNLCNAILANLRQKHYDIRRLPMDEEIAREMKPIEALYRVVNRSIQLHTYGPQLFPEKLRDFDYSVGPTEDLLGTRGADSLVLVSALGQVSPIGSKASVSLCVADSSGTILWYSVKGSMGEYDLRDPKRVAELVEDILSSFPEARG